MSHTESLIRDPAKMLMVIITTAYEFIKHSEILSPAADRDFCVLPTLHRQKCFSHFTNSIFFTLLLTDGLLSSRGAPAVRRGEVVGLHHLPV